MPTLVRKDEVVSRLDETLAPGRRYGFAAARDVKLPKHGGDVRADGVEPPALLVRNRLIGKPARHRPEHLGLGRRKGFVFLEF